MFLVTILGTLQHVQCNVYSSNSNHNQIEIQDEAGTKISKMIHKRQSPRNFLGNHPQETICVDVSKWGDVYYKIEEKSVCKTEFRKQCIDREEEVY